MAIRRYLLLAQIEHRDRLADALKASPFVSLDVAGPWCWSVASAFAESHENLRGVVQQAQAPFLLFTTFDGDGWHVSAGTADGQVAEATHTFAKDWRQGDKAAAKRVRRLAELIRGVVVDVDARALECVLSGGALSQAETDSDLGDLPRLLDALGAVGIVDIPQDPPKRRVRPNQPTKTLTLLKGHEGRAQSSIRGVQLPVAHAGDLAALALFCDPDALLSLIADGEDLPAIALSVPCKISVAKGSVYVEADGGVGLKANVIKLAAETLAAAPGLEAITIVSGRSRGGKDVGWHRYTGAVKAGACHIETATPAVDSATLASALQLIGERRATGPLQCESEAEAVVNRCAKSLYLTPEQLPKRKGTELVTAKDGRLYVILEMFRVRFAKTWDASAAQKAEAAENRAWNRLEEKVLQAAAKFQADRTSG